VVDVTEVVGGEMNNMTHLTPSAEVTPHALYPHEDVGGEGFEEMRRCVNPIAEDVGGEEA
jgi:hypothetical protein